MNQFIATKEEMLELGRQCGLAATTGSVWCLSGNLGAGKTHWTKGFTNGAGSEAVVTSPTFGLVHEYPGKRATIFHFDFYRIGSAEELIVLGWDDYLERDGIIVVEWGEKYSELLPVGTHQVQITTLKDGRREVKW